MTDTIVPDDKDWTWVIERRCPDCGFDASKVTGEQLGAQIRAAADPWEDVLARPDATVRRTPGKWSDLEYGAHVRDVCRVFDDRLTLMLTNDDAVFDNWDQDAAAAAGNYALQDPVSVADAIHTGAGELADDYDEVPDDAWQRRGLRSNGSHFTVLTLGQYCLHDLVHHLHDVGATSPHR
ncbi:DinB family protein [Flexivirga caeni]|uniref:DinB family protein n=1 Tax=Flexivirga caeni TaxID=2294115 RepID=A0A3M9MDG0_9MICO|nr:DinB family protein [Flexivirga caeni]RNI23187.1 DinB family protein [Flexivirga caeni]